MTYDPNRILAGVLAALDSHPEWSERRWARETGLSPGTIRNLRQGRKSGVQSPKVETVYKLAEKSGLSVWEILGETPVADMLSRRSHDLVSLLGEARLDIRAIEQVLTLLTDALRAGDGRIPRDPYEGEIPRLAERKKPH